MATASARAASEVDWALYGRLLDVFDQAQVYVRNALDQVAWADVIGRAISVDVSGRAKTLDTLVQKLARSPGLKLPYIRDIAGVRLVGDFTLAEQADIAQHIRHALGCPDAAIVDRIAEPESGYRALHVVVTVNHIAVEVQVRTRLQSLWADLYERTADTWGRQIRYGQSPDPAPDEQDTSYQGPTRAEAVAALIATSVENIAGLEEVLDAVRDVRNRLRGLQTESFQTDDLPEGWKTREEAEATLAEVEERAEGLWKAMEARLVAMAEQLEQDAHATSLRDTPVSVKERS